MGHSSNDRTRVSAALISSNDGNVDQVNANTYSGYFTRQPGIRPGRTGSATGGRVCFRGTSSNLLADFRRRSGAGSSLGDKSFHREGVFGDFYLNKLDVSLYYQHGWDSAYFGTASTPLTGLPLGARSPTWNGAFVEPHYTVNPQFIVLRPWGMGENVTAGIRFSNKSDLGDI